MKIISLDISGAGTGWAYADNHTLVTYGKYISNISKERGERLLHFHQWIVDLLNTYKPDIVLIEKPYLGRNSNVLVNLSKFVAVAELSVFLVLDKSVEDTWFIDPRTIKKLLKVKKPRDKNNAKDKHDENKKIMVKKINELYGLKLQYKPGKSKKYCDDDIADAVALLHAFWTLQTKNAGN